MGVTSDQAEPLGLDAWLAALRAFPELRDVEVTRDEQRALLEVTRIAAHRSERIAAPITAFALGLAFATLPAPERAEGIRRLASELEAAPADR